MTPDLSLAEAAELLGCEVVSCEPMAGGENSPVHQVRLAGQAEPVVVKQYQKRRQRAKEVHVYRLLAGNGIDRVPRVLAAGEYHVVLTLMPGRPLGEVSDGMDDAARFAVYRQLGEFLARLHGIKLDAFGYLVTRIVDPKPDNTAYMTGLFAGCPGAVLCHNDFHEGNVLIDERGELTGVIDMENAVAADPLTDIAKTDCYSIRGDRAKWDGLVAGYGPAVLARAEVLPLYRLSHALQLSNWFAQVGRTDALDGLADDMRQILT